MTTTTAKENLNSTKGWQELNKIFGNKMFRGDEAVKFDIPVIPFPSPSLADASHFGGVPHGKISQFHGPEGSGKTFMAMLTAKQVLEDDPTAEVAWFDCENSFSRQWAEDIGLDMSRFHYSNENVGAEIFSVICGKPSKTGKGKGSPGILDLNKQGVLNVKLVVIDSIAAIIPPVELDRDMAELEMAALARFLPKALRVTSAKLAQTDTALLCINHAKEAFGDNVNKYTYPGGRGLRYMLSLVVLFDTTQSKSATLFDEDGLKYGHRVDCTVEKTRGGPNKWKASIWFNFRDGCIANMGQEVALLGEAYGVVVRPNALNWVYGDIKIKGMDNFFAYLEDNEELMEEIINECKEIKARGGTRSPELAAADVATDSDASTDEE
jgi:recombination protein RecA